MTDDTPTPKRFAAARRLIPASTAAKARARRSIESGLPIPKPIICFGWTESRHRPAGNPPAIHDARKTLYYFNGEQFTIVSPDENFYASSIFAEGFDALVEAARERTGLVLPLWSIMSPSIKERWLEGIERGAYLGTTVIAGEPVHHLAFSEYDEDWQVWISTDPDHPVIVMLIGTDLYQQGWPQYRAYSNDWDFAPEIEPGIFTFKPDPDDMPVAMPDLLAAASEGDATTASDSGPGDGNAE